MPVRLLFQGWTTNGLGKIQWSIRDDMAVLLGVGGLLTGTCITCRRITWTK